MVWSVLDNVYTVRGVSVFVCKEQGSGTVACDN